LRGDRPQGRQDRRTKGPSLDRGREEGDAGARALAARARTQDRRRWASLDQLTERQVCHLSLPRRLQGAGEGGYARRPTPRLDVLRTKGGQDLVDRDLLGWPGQQEAARLARDRAEHAGALEARHHPREHILVEPELGGERLLVERTPAAAEMHRYLRG